MIPGKFDYHQPDSVQAAVSLLSELGDDARVLAGGHSLIPMMKLRLAVPEHVIDLRLIQDLKFIRVEGGTVSIGAMTTQHELINHSELATVAPIVRETSLQIADPQIRYQGTIGGNIANGDPVNDMPALMLCLNATLILVGPEGQRKLAARNFYEAAYFTARDDQEILTEIRFPVSPGGYAYEKQKRKIGDYATAAAAVLLRKSADGASCEYASIALTNLADTPVYCEKASQILQEQGVSDESIAQAITSCLGDIEPVDDNRGPVEFKIHAAANILKRAIHTAWSRT